MVLRSPTREYQPDRASRPATRTATHPADHTTIKPQRELRKITAPDLTNDSPYQLSARPRRSAPLRARRRGSSTIRARRQRPSGGTRARPPATRDQRWKVRGRRTDVPAEAKLERTNLPAEARRKRRTSGRREFRRRDGGGNRRGRRCALSRRRSSDWHPLWGLSDASDRGRVGEREHEPVAATTSPETDPVGDGVYCTPRTARPAYDPPLLAPQAPSPTGPQTGPPANKWTLA